MNQLDETLPTENKFPTKTRNKYLLIIAGLTVFNIIVFKIFIKTGGYDSHGNYITYDQTKSFESALTSFLIGFPILSFILGLLVAVFPYRQLTFSKKYFRASLLTLLTFNSISTICLTLIMAMIVMTFANTFF